MNCPNCGSPILADQQFCRSCGAELLADEPRRIGPRGWAFIGLMMAFGGILLALAGKFAGLQWVLYAGVLVSISGMFSIAAVSMLGSSRRRRPRAASPIQPDILPRANTTNKLLPIGDNDFVPSVVEGTTELLKTPAASRSNKRD